MTPDVQYQPHELEVADLTVVTTDGRQAAADIVAWSPRLQRMVTVRAHVHLSGPKFDFWRSTIEPCDDPALPGLVMSDGQVKADIYVAMAQQRAILQFED